MTSLKQVTPLLKQRPSEEINNNSRSFHVSSISSTSSCIGIGSVVFPYNYSSSLYPIFESESQYKEFFTQLRSAVRPKLWIQGTIALLSSLASFLIVYSIITGHDNTNPILQFLFTAEYDDGDDYYWHYGAGEYWIHPYSALVILGIGMLMFCVYLHKVITVEYQFHSLSALMHVLNAIYSSSNEANSFKFQLIKNDPPPSFLTNTLLYYCKGNAENVENVNKPLFQIQILRVHSTYMV